MTLFSVFLNTQKSRTKTNARDQEGRNSSGPMLPAMDRHGGVGQVVKACFCDVNLSC